MSDVSAKVEAALKNGAAVYVDKKGKVCMIRCIECGKENWAMAVSSGTCAWCGFDANLPPVGAPGEAGET